MRENSKMSNPGNRVDLSGTLVDFHLIVEKPSRQFGKPGRHFGKPSRLSGKPGQLFGKPGNFSGNWVGFSGISAE